jgi:hypothetical protein
VSGAPEQSFQEYVERLDAPADDKRTAIAFVESYNAARQERISVQSVAQSQEAADRIEGDRLFRLVGGYDRLVDWLWQGIDPERRQIFLGAVVAAIEWERGEVRISTAQGRFTTPRAIVTAPLVVLKSGAIRIDPSPRPCAPPARASKWALRCASCCASGVSFGRTIPRCARKASCEPRIPGCRSGGPGSPSRFR